MPSPVRFGIPAADGGGDGPRRRATGSPPGRARDAARPRYAPAGARVPGRRGRRLRRRADADRPARPPGRGLGSVRPRERPLGRQGVAACRGEAIPLPMRIVHVARDAAFQRMLGGDEFAAQVVRSRAGGAFDPDIAEPFADRAAEMLAIDPHASVWAETLACEPRPEPHARGGGRRPRAGRDRCDFADLASPYLVGHSAGVAELAAVAGRRCGLGAAEIVALRRAALVHDLGRVAVPVRIWQHAGPLSPDDWERVRLHAYHTERVLESLAVPRRARPDRDLPPRAPRRLRLPPRDPGRRTRHARAPARCRRRLPRHDGAAAAPRAALRRSRPPRPSARRHAPVDWIATRPAPCSRRPTNASRGSGDRPV